ncbi:arginyltransferase [Vibrio algicola]|uniref:Aspartate/glutamate leucyltransferase n=1 Tax=Vibrio algicola TaxID=2662262 RepID=A0A5Q0TD35_9VIBR|nr:arginyltransferase [Vibrio algicola]
MSNTNIRIGLTENHPCSYLPEQEERIAVVLDDDCHSTEHYALFLANGFRRSGNMIYKPHCDECNACQSIRLSVNHIQLSKSQKRIRNKAAGLRWVFQSELDPQWFDLYEQYINQRHSTGSMYPANKETFDQFSHTDWMEPQFLHVYEDDKLIAVAVTDNLDDCLSAFYTFFQPDHPLSLGTLCILLQLEQCKKLAKQWLYLGYQVDDCPAMNYKVRFHHHQKLVNQRWQG